MAVGVFSNPSQCGVTNFLHWWVVFLLTLLFLLFASLGGNFINLLLLLEFAGLRGEFLDNFFHNYVGRRLRHRSQSEDDVSEKL